MPTTDPNYIAAAPHTSKEKQVGRNDPLGRTDVINRPVKGVWANLQRIINTVISGASPDGTDLTTVTAYTGTIRALKGIGAFAAIGIDCKNNAGTPDTQFDLDADIIVLKDPSTGDVVVRTNPGAAITNNISTAGPAADGRDQAGAFSASSWVHFYWIWNGTTLATLSSAAAPATAPTLPTGYTHWAYAGPVRLDGSSLLVKTRIKGAWCFYDAEQTALAAGAATAETSVDVAAYVPPNATAFKVHARLTIMTDAVGDINALVQLRAATGLNFYASNPLMRGLTALATTQGWPDVEVTIPNVGQAFLYLWTVTLGSGQALLAKVGGYSVNN